MPNWAAAIICGRFSSPVRTVRARPEPAAALGSIWLRRTDTRANSAPTKKPLASTSRAAKRSCRTLMPAPPSRPRRCGRSVRARPGGGRPGAPRAASPAAPPRPRGRGCGPAGRRRVRRRSRTGRRGPPGRCGAGCRPGSRRPRPRRRRSGRPRRGRGPVRAGRRRARRARRGPRRRVPRRCPPG